MVSLCLSKNKVWHFRVLVSMWKKIRNKPLKGKKYLTLKLVLYYFSLLFVLFTTGYPSVHHMGLGQNAGHGFWMNEWMNAPKETRYHFFLCLGKNVCFRESQSDVIKKWGLWKVIGIRWGPEGCTLVLGLVPSKRRHQSACSPFCSPQEGGSLQPRRRFSPEPIHAGTMISKISPPELRK